jgi:hypothetical protein
LEATKVFSTSLTQASAKLGWLVLRDEAQTSPDRAHHAMKMLFANVALRHHPPIFFVLAGHACLSHQN